MKIDRSFWYTNHVKEKVKSTITADTLIAAQAGELLLLKRNNLMTAWKPLSWNLCHVRPLSNVEFPMSAEHLS